jgi:hypothetical protein
MTGFLCEIMPNQRVNGAKCSRGQPGSGAEPSSPCSRFSVLGHACDYWLGRRSNFIVVMAETSSVDGTMAGAVKCAHPLKIPMRKYLAAVFAGRSANSRN